MTTEDFIARNLSADVRRLALEGHRYPEVDMPWALDQIRGYQTARQKLPFWSRIAGIVYPPHISLEQCSSEPTARYKAALAKRLLAGPSKLIDLTGGFGVDFSFLAPGFSEAVYVEQQPHLCDIAEKNFRLLGLDAQVVCADAVDFLQSLPPASAPTLIYLDPARRDSHGGRTYALADCTPNILPLVDQLLEKASIVMVKLSPMLDWHKAVADLRHVAELHILSVRNECKEIVLVTSPPALPSREGAAAQEGGVQNGVNPSLRITCADLSPNSEEPDSIFSYTLAESQNVPPQPRSGSLPFIGEGGGRGHFLYEPNAALMKAGCFNLLAERFAVEQIAPHSHLFVSSELRPFPGRVFEVMAVTSLNKKELRQVLAGISQANIAVRNFPLTADQLRQKLRLRDGGQTYIFGTTDAENRHILLFCQKAEKQECTK